ncbi:MAG: YggT family protein [Acidimicrobiia bacterium]
MTGILCLLIWAFIAALIIRIILDWVQVPASHLVGRARSSLAKVTDPVLLPLRRVIPPIRMGAVALDVSVMVLLFGLFIVRNAIC